MLGTSLHLKEERSVANKRALITGVTGQDGSYMVDFILNNTDHMVYGIRRRSSNPNLDNIKHNLDNPRFKMLIGDLSDSNSIDEIVKEIKFTCY